MTNKIKSLSATSSRQPASEKQLEFANL